MGVVSSSLLRWRALLWRVRDLLRLALAGHARLVGRTLWRRLYSNSTSLGLERDLTLPFAVPPARVSCHVRPLAAHDDVSFLDIRQAGLSDTQVYDRLGQLRLLRAELGTCYLAIGPDDTPVYMEWLITSRDNDRLRAFFGNLYPTLRQDEALLEGAFTPDLYRGQGIMSNALAQIAERAGDLGVRRVLTFVDETNAASIKGCRNAGFTPFIRRSEAHRLLRRRVAFMPLAAPPSLNASIT